MSDIELMDVDESSENAEEKSTASADVDKDITELSQQEAVQLDNSEVIIKGNVGETSSANDVKNASENIDEKEIEPKKKAKTKVASKKPHVDKVESEKIVDEDKDKHTSDDERDIIEEPVKAVYQTKSDQPLPIPIPKDMSTLRMQLSKVDIERLMKEGALELVAEGYYKVKPESLKSIISNLPLSESKKTDKLSSNQGNMSVQPTAPAVSLVPGNQVVVQGTPLEQVGIQTPSSQVTCPTVVQPSFVTLMPINPVSGTSSSTIVAVPIQQSVTFNPNLPTFVAVSQERVSTVSSKPRVTSGITPVLTSRVDSSTLPSKPRIATSSIGISTLSSTPLVVAPVTTSTLTSSANEFELVELPNQKHKEQLPAEQISSLVIKSIHKVITHDATDISSPPVSSLSKPGISLSTSGLTGLKRKPQIESTKIKKPYRFAKPLRKRRRTTKLKDFVSDLNSSDDEDEVGQSQAKSFGVELASMFFKKIGEPKTANRSLLDKLHKAIFNDADTESDDEESQESEAEEVISDIYTGKAKYQTINCPGPGQYEAYIGPGNNSKLSIVRCRDNKRVKNFLYEVYKVRVTSDGREANTNILIPVPEGYKFRMPPIHQEEQVEFSHIPHEDPQSTNHVNPLFLEKLAETELKLRKCKDEIKVLRGRYLELFQEYSNRPQFSTLSDLVGAAAKFLTEDQLVFFLMQLKAGAHNMQGIRYSVREKVLALSIYQKSPEVYRWLRKLFNLPPKRMLDQWLEEIGSQDPQLLKKLMYHIYTTYNFKADI